MSKDSEEILAKAQAEALALTDEIGSFVKNSVEIYGARLCVNVIGSMVLHSCCPELLQKAVKEIEAEIETEEKENILLPKPTSIKHTKQPIWAHHNLQGCFAQWGLWDKHPEGAHKAVMVVAFFEPHGAKVKIRAGSGEKWVDQESHPMFLEDATAWSNDVNGKTSYWGENDNVSSLWRLQGWGGPKLSNFLQGVDDEGNPLCPNRSEKWWGNDYKDSLVVRVQSTGKEFKFGSKPESMEETLEWASRTTATWSLGKLDDSRKLYFMPHWFEKPQTDAPYCKPIRTDGLRIRFSKNWDDDSLDLQEGSLAEAYGTALIRIQKHPDPSIRWKEGFSPESVPYGDPADAFFIKSNRRGFMSVREYFARRGIE